RMPTLRMPWPYRTAGSRAMEGTRICSIPGCAAMIFTMILAMLTPPIGQAVTDPLLRSGLYEVTSRLELPHVERWAIDKTMRICLFSHDESDALPVPVLSDNNPFATCWAENFATDRGTFHYDIVCRGRDAARAHATYQFAADKFAGRIAMIMGAKNMTM